MPPWKPDDDRWRWLILGALIVMTAALMFGGAVFGQGDGRPPFQALPILGTTTNDEMVKTGDLANHAFRVNVVAGSGSGVSGTIGTAQGTTVAPAGAVDASGFVASFTLDNSGNLKVSDGTSAATGTIAPSRVSIMGGWGKSAVATAVTVCDQFATISLINGGNTQVITGVAGQQIHICSIQLVVASATAVGIFEGSGTLCNTNRLGMFGSHSTHNGVNISTTGGFIAGTGIGSVMFTQNAGANVCLGNSTTAVVAGNIKWTSY